MKLQKYNEYNKLHEDFEYQHSRGSLPNSIPKSEYQNIELIPFEHVERVGIKDRVFTWDGYKEVINIPLKDKDLFLKKLIYISGKLEINPNWMMALISQESNFFPMIRNAGVSKSGKRNTATGFIQFINSSAVDIFGVTSKEIGKMDHFRQLDLVYAWLEYHRRGKTIRDVADFYLLVFLPAAVGKPDNYIFPSKYAKANNQMFGKTSKKKGTMADFREYVMTISPFKTVHNNKFNLADIKNNKNTKASLKDVKNIENVKYEIADFIHYDPSEIQSLDFFKSLSSTNMSRA